MTEKSEVKSFEEIWSDLQEIRKKLSDLAEAEKALRREIDDILKN